MKPIVDAQMLKDGNEKLHRHDTNDEQGTFISWLMKHTNEHKRNDPLVFANNQMGCK